jgi:hypothetical protein
VSKPAPTAPERDSDRGKRATFDRRTGAVSGSGSDIGNPGNGEDYDSDLSVGSGSDRKTGGRSNSA